MIAHKTMREPGFKNEVAARIAQFLTEIGLEVETSAVREKTVLPGIHLDRGILIVDEPKLLHPGDMLHEAGHIAVTPAAQRQEL